MYEESDPEITELDIESKTWEKLEKNMQVMGFQEGAVKGKEISLQYGFNCGYSDGFKVGEHLGKIQGRLSFQKKMGNLDATSEMSKDLRLSTTSCVLCKEQNEKSFSVKENHSHSLEKVIHRQRTQNDRVIKTSEDIYYKIDLKKR